MPDQVEPASGAKEQALQAEIARQNKIIQALMNRAERNASIQGSDFNLFQTAITLEDQVHLRTVELEAARLENEKITRALRESENRNRLLLENSPMSIHEIGVDGRITYMNRPGILMFGLKEECEVKGSLYLDAVSDADRERIGELLAKAYNGETCHFVFKSNEQGGRIYKSCFAPIKNKNGVVEILMGITEDITERRELEEALSRKQALERIRKALGATIHAITVIVETRDPYTAGHQRRVADLARAIATEMNLSFDMIDGIRMAATIHDLGKISVPAEILTKPTKLTNIEFMLIKTHPQSGYDILKDIDFPWPVARMVLEHHEKMDGSGYPNGLMGDNILMESKILSVADVVEAMASHRPYRPGLGIDAALNEIEKNKGIFYDNTVAEACIRLFREKGYQLQ